MRDKGKAFAPATPSVSTVETETPIPCSKFVGRSSELRQMSEMLCPGKGQKSIVLWGLPGIGKTQLVIQYLEDHGKEYTSKLWVSMTELREADGNAPNMALETFSEIAAQVKRDESQPVENAYSPRFVKSDAGLFFVRNWLRSEQNTSWILILDGVDDFDVTDMRKYIPKCSHGTIIVTSTKANAPKILGMEGIEVGPLDSRSGSQVILRKLRKSDDYESGKCSYQRYRNTANVGSFGRIP